MVLAVLDFLAIMMYLTRLSISTCVPQACEELAKKTSNEEAILERQIRQQRDKDDAEMARRAELRRRERQAIAEDRVLQRQRREEARVQEREAARRRMAAWAEEDEKVCVGGRFGSCCVH